MQQLRDESVRRRAGRYRSRTLSTMTAGAGLLLALAACAPPWGTGPTPLPKPGVPVESRTRAKGPPPAAEKETPPETVESAPPAPPAPTTAMLRGMTPAEVRQVLGAPTSTRQSAAAEVWRYVADTCAVEVFFALDLADKSRRVVTLESSPEDSGLACVSRQRLAAGGR